MVRTERSPPTPEYRESIPLGSDTDLRSSKTTLPEDRAQSSHDGSFVCQMCA